MTATDERIRREALEYGIVRDTDPATHRVRWTVTCCECLETARKGWQPSFPVESMLIQLRRAGWTLTQGKAAFCKNCLHPHRQHPPKGQAIMTAATEPPAPNPKIARRIYELLDANFDEHKRVYASGWTDQRIADETGASLEIVARIRNQGYAELAEDPAITHMRDEIDLLKMEAQEAMRLTGEQVGGLIARADDLTRKVNQMAAARKIAG